VTGNDQDTRRTHLLQVAGSLLVAVLLVVITISLVTGKLGRGDTREMYEEREDLIEQRQENREERLEEREDRGDG
jgi:hypothetical protein